MSNAFLGRHHRKPTPPATTSALAFAALLYTSTAFTTPARAENIDTTTGWNGSTSFVGWGPNWTPTYGQTITATPTRSRLDGFTFYLFRSGGVAGTAAQYQAFVYQWDSTAQHITGAPLYASSISTAPGVAAYRPVSFNTGSVVLTPGQQYVLFITTSTIPGQPTVFYSSGANPNPGAYAAGQFVYSDVTDFGLLSSSSSWGLSPYSLAFIASLSPSTLRSFLPSQAPGNPTNVALGLDKFILAGGALPGGFQTLYTLGPQQLQAALTQMSGETGTQSQQAGIQLMNSYLSLLTDPFVAGRSGVGAAMGFAPERPDVPADIAMAYAKYAKAPIYTKAPAVDEPRYDVWGAAFGGESRTAGDAAGTGSSDTTARSGGVAAGIDYRLSRDALIGVSMAAAPPPGRSATISAAAAATWCWQASTAHRSSAMPMCPARSPMPITGCPPTAPSAWPASTS